MNSGVPNLQRLLAALNESSSPSSNPSSSSPSNSHIQPWPQQTQAIQTQASSSSVYDPQHHYTAFPPLHTHLSQDSHQGNNTIPFRRGVLSPPPTTDINTNTSTQVKNLASQTNLLRPAPTTTPDASQITTWPAAVKHISRHILSNLSTTSKIRHLISQQHKHEQEWWTQREAIVRRHANRAGNQDKAAALLKSLGVVVVVPAPAASSNTTTISRAQSTALPPPSSSLPAVTTTTATTKAKPANADAVADAGAEQELREFDRKVHRALQDMARDYDGQLRKLGVPFFAIRRDLVLGDNDDKSAMVGVTGVGSGSGTNNGKLDKGELRDLQRRVVEHLEDLLVD